MSDRRTFLGATSAALIKIRGYFPPEATWEERITVGGKIDIAAVDHGAVALIEIAQTPHIFPVLVIGAIMRAARSRGAKRRRDEDRAGARAVSTR